MIFEYCEVKSLIFYKDFFLFYTFVNKDGDLDRTINRWKEEKKNIRNDDSLVELILKWLVQISSAINHLHNLKIMHRDIKPQNILISRNDIKLTDFSVSRFIPDNNEKIFNEQLNLTKVGTMAYMAPEIMQNKGLNY